MIAVEGTAECCHAVNAADSPAGAGLFEAAVDQILHSAFHCSATVSLAVVYKNYTGTRKRHGRRTHLYAYWGIEPRSFE